MLTRGYETVPLFFHPYYRDGSVFRYLGRETTGAKNHVIAFAQIPDKARLRGKIESFGILFGFFLQGFVWVDPTTYQILRMRTDLLFPLFEAGLTRQTSVIDLAQVRFDETGQALWLPHEVTVYSDIYGAKFPQPTPIFAIQAIYGRCERREQANRRSCKTRSPE